MSPKFEYLQGHTSGVNAMLNHPKGFMTGSEDKTVRLWDLRLNRTVRCLCGDIYDEVGCLSTYPGNEHMVCVGCDNAVLLYDLRNPGIIVKDAVSAITHNQDCVNAIVPVTTNDTSYLAICDDKGDVVLYNLTNEEDSITLEGMHSNICLDMLVYYDQSTPYFYSGGCDQRIHRFDMEGEVLDSWSISPIASSIQSVNPPFVQRLARSHDGSLFFGCTDGTIRCLGKKDDYPVVMTHLYSISDLKSIIRQNEHIMLSAGADCLFTIHKEDGKKKHQFSEKSRLELKWKPNAVELIGDDVLIGGASKFILRANSFL